MMEFTDEKSGVWAGCQGATCCPLASELRESNRRMTLLEHSISEKCGKMGMALRQAAELMMEIGRVEKAVVLKTQFRQEEIIRECVRLLMEEKDQQGHYVFRRKTHWQGIYRSVVDRKLGVADGDYMGFERLSHRIEPQPCRIGFSLSALKQISKTNFTKPFERWTYDPVYFKTRRPFDQMIAVVERFNQLLEKDGL